MPFIIAIKKFKSNKNKQSIVKFKTKYFTDNLFLNKKHFRENLLSHFLSKNILIIYEKLTSIALLKF